MTLRYSKGGPNSDLFIWPHDIVPLSHLDTIYSLVRPQDIVNERTDPDYILCQKGVAEMQQVWLFYNRNAICKSTVSPRRISHSLRAYLVALNPNHWPYWHRLLMCSLILDTAIDSLNPCPFDRLLNRHWEPVLMLLVVLISLTFPYCLYYTV